MNGHRIEIVIAGYSASFGREMLESGSSNDLPEGISFAVESEPAKLGTLRLDPAVIVAIIGSATLLARDVIKVIADKLKQPCIMSVTLADGTELTVPSNVNEAELERLTSAIRKVQDVQRIGIILTEDV
jgi:hypothetical protein